MSEPESIGNMGHTTADDAVRRERRAIGDLVPKRSPEHQAQRTIVRSVAVAVPLVVASFIGIVALALRDQQPDWSAWLAMAAAVGVIAGVFAGTLAGFVRTSYLFDR